MNPTVVVVGGGTAGCAVAARLAEAGWMTTLVEPGPDYGPRDQGAWPSDLLDATTLATSHDWGYSGPAADGRTVLFDRARVIGGCSAHNGSTMSIGWSGDDIDLPAGWSTAALGPARERAAERTRIN
ncbi:MAG: FAD-dependent oxidoreductase, partial [Actinomycetota bacterium]